MKQFTLLAVSLLFFAAVHAQAPAQTEAKDITKVLSFKNDNYDFGKIPQGKPVEFDLEVKNISTDSVKVENVQVSCGCTTPKWQPGPYAAGSTFKIGLGFNAAALGQFVKTVTVYFNNGMTKVVTFKGETFAAPDNSAPKNEAGKIKP